MKSIPLKKLFTFCIALMLAFAFSATSFETSGKRIVRTTLRSVKAEKTAAQKKIKSQKICFDTDSSSLYNRSQLVFTGFDKTVASTKESMFITNNTDKTLLQVEIDLNYTTTSGNQLHRQIKTVDCNIPPKETRIVEFPSWDKHKSFYYKNSNVPRRRATPFDVSIRLKSIILSN